MRIPETRWIKVVLPAPFGPIMPSISPSSIVKETLLTATRPENALVKPVVTSLLMDGSCLAVFPYRLASQADEALGIFSFSHSEATPSNTAPAIGPIVLWMPPRRAIASGNNVKWASKAVSGVVKPYDWTCIAPIMPWMTDVITNATRR